MVSKGVFSIGGMGLVQYLQDGAPKIAFSCLVSDLYVRSLYYHGSYDGFVNQLITGGPHPV